MPIEVNPPTNVDIPELDDVPAEVRIDNKTASRLSKPFRLQGLDGTTITTEPVDSESEYISLIREKIKEQKMVERFEGDVLFAYSNFKQLSKESNTEGLNQNELNLRMPFSRDIINRFFSTLSGKEDNMVLLNKFGLYIHDNIPYASAFQDNSEIMSSLAGEADPKLANQVYKLAYGSDLQHAYSQGAFICGDFASLFTSFANEIIGVEASVITVPQNYTNFPIGHDFVLVQYYGYYYVFDPTLGLKAKSINQAIKNPEYNFGGAYLSEGPQVDNGLKSSRFKLFKSQVRETLERTVG